MEINNNKPTKQNRGVFNPQFRKHPLQILQRERKDQDQVQAPLYIEAAPSRYVDANDKEDEDQIYYVYMEDGESEEELEKNMKRKVKKLISHLIKKKWMITVKNLLILCNSDYIKQ